MNLFDGNNPAPFAQPGGSSFYFKPKDHDGHLVLITEFKGVEVVNDKYQGQVEQMTVALVDLTTQQAHDNAKITGYKALQNSVNTDGRPTLGRVGKRTAQASGNEYWTLLPFSDEDAKAATEYIQKNDTPPF